MIQEFIAAWGYVIVFVSQILKLLLTKEIIKGYNATGEPT